MKKVSVIAVFTCAAMAMGNSCMKMPTFADIDTDKSGMISPAEFKKHQEMRMQYMNICCGCYGMKGIGRKSMMNMPQFSEYDLNNDGFISESELQEVRNKRMAQHAQEGKMMKNVATAPSFSEMDINKDGKISPDEFQKHQAEQMQTPKK